MKILFVASEGLPFSKSGGLADVVGALPKALAGMDHEVAVLLPRSPGVKAARQILPSLTIPLGEMMRFPAIVGGPKSAGVRYFFVDDAEYFDREQLYGDRTGDYLDNAERFAEFSRAAIEFVKHVWMPDVIHCHDWQAALVPVLLRTVYAADPVVRRVPVVLTIHNLAYQGVFPRAALARIGLPETLFHMDALEFYGKVNFLKGGIVFADCLSTVSRKYAEEIQTAEYGCGLEGVLSKRAREGCLAGILNGADYSEWSPESDTFIAANYSVDHLEGKRACKKDLLDAFGLPGENVGIPLLGIVSRLAEQKGMDLVEQIAGELLRGNSALVVLGTGQAAYERFFRGLAAKYPKRAGVKIGFDNALAHKIEAGADVFLMPSRFEPCGLNQIYSLRYGTVPVVRATGGLDDTIVAYGSDGLRGTGFKFQAYESKALLACVKEALDIFRDPEAWRILQTNGMTKDFSWGASAAAYVDLYQAAWRARIPGESESSNPPDDGLAPKGVRQREKDNHGRKHPGSQ